METHGDPSGRPNPLGRLHDPTAHIYSVGQVTALLGVTPWYLRRLDALGVVHPSRSRGDQRRYSQADIERLMAARELMARGVNALGAAMVLDLRDRVAQLEAALGAVAEDGSLDGGASRSREN